jgi:hypothetical protein
MPSARWIVLAYLALSLYDTGMSWALQLMHYPLYHDVGPAEFSRYIQRNNQRAVVPAILPALATLGVSLLMVWRRPVMVPPAVAMVAVLLNIVVLISTAMWQGRLHSQLAQAGKSESAINRLVITNWIRTAAFTIQAIFALWIIDRLLGRSQ